MSIPEKYNGEREWDKRSLLYEMYWGDYFFSRREIARRLGVTHDKIQQALERHNIPRRGKRDIPRYQYLRERKNEVESETTVDWTTFD